MYKYDKQVQFEHKSEAQCLRNPCVANILLEDDDEELEELDEGYLDTWY